MSFDLAAIRHALATAPSVARVVVAGARGSVPREPGAAMLITACGQTGTIGGGALEHAATRAARAMLGAPGSGWHSHHPLGPGLGQCCGGAVTLVTEVFDLSALEAIDPGRPFVRALRGAASAIPLPVTRLLRAARGEGRSLAPTLVDGWFLEPHVTPDRHLWIYGAGHVGRALVSVLAPLPDVSVTWVDTGPERFPPSLPDRVAALPAPDPVTALSLAPDAADHLILTYSHALDLALCDAVLRRAFRSAGLIGSATKWARFRRRLTGFGHAPDCIDRIVCPIGDPALGKAPQAIAIGVAQRYLAGAKARSRNHSRSKTA